MILSEISVIGLSKAYLAVSGSFWGFFLPLITGFSAIILLFHAIGSISKNPEWKKLSFFWTRLFTFSYFTGIIPYLALILFVFFGFPDNIWLTSDHLGNSLIILVLITFSIQTLIIVAIHNNVKNSNKKGAGFLIIIQFFSTIIFVIPLLAANSFFNHPVGSDLNPTNAFFELKNLQELLFSPFALHKYLHTISSGCVVACLVVLGTGAWYLRKKRDLVFAQRSMIIASVFGLIASLFVSVTGDTSTYQIAQHQPMKLAAMEALYKGQTKAPLVAFGFINDQKKPGDSLNPFKFKIEIPSMLSKLATRDRNAFVPGIEDLLYGNYLYSIEPVTSKIENGTLSIISFALFNSAKNKADSMAANQALHEMKKKLPVSGYAYIEKPEDTVPYVHIVFNSFHSMVLLGFYFIFLFLTFIFLLYKGKITNYKRLLLVAILTIPTGFFAYEMGWVLSEVGRQPWVIQNILPINRIFQNVNSSQIKIVFVIMLIVNITTFVVFIRQVLKQIKTGPEIIN